MAIADTAKLIVDLSLKGNFASSLAASERSLSKFDRAITGTQGRAYKAGQQIGTGIKAGAVIAASAIGFLAANVVAGLRSLDKLESQVAQTNAVLKSTKGVAGQTATSIRDLADKYEQLNATVDDTIIQSGENLLLTFTNIRKQAFEPALKAALDMNQALGRGPDGLTGTVRILGKALNDPAKGLTALQRVGVTFTDGQKNQIKQALLAGKTWKAQSIILDELNKRFGGSFLAGGNTTAGKVAKFRDAIDDLQRVLATAMLPVIGRIADALTKFLKDPAIIKGVNDLGKGIADMFSDKNLAAGADFLKGAFNTAKDVAPVVVSAAKATLGLVQGAVSLFKSLPPEIQKLAVGAFAVNKLTGGLVTNIAGGIVDTVGKQFLQRGGTPANPLFVADVTGGLGGALGGAKGIGLLESVGLTTPVLAGLTVGVMGAVGLGTLLDAALNNKGQTFDQANQQLAKSGVTLSTTAVTTSNQLASGRQVVHAGKGASLVIVGTGTTITAPSAKLPGDASDARGLGAKLSTFTDQLGRAATGLKDDRVDLKQLQRGTLAFLADLRNYVRRAENDLKSAKPKDLLGDIKTIRGFIVAAQHGNVAETKGALSALKAALGKTHDSKTAAILREAIRKVGDKLDYRVFVRQQLAKATAIAKSSETTKEKIADLERIQAHFVRNGDVKVAAAIGKKIDEAKRSQAYAARATTEAIKDKDLSITNNITVPVKVQVSSRETSQTQITFKRAFGTLS